ncbi:ATP-binding protein [Carboxylicivirga taeanensis]|uniref:ATP-binding protein n=1 Tax=Carboxylicivirga taeanensis TaxID=1416875 RepID=UPI003F6E2015
MFFSSTHIFAFSSDVKKDELSGLAQKCLVCNNSSEFKEKINAVKEEVSKLSEKQLLIVGIDSPNVNLEEAFILQFSYCIYLYEQKEYEKSLSLLPIEVSGIQLDDCVFAYYYEIKGNLYRYTKQYKQALNCFIRSIEFYNGLEDDIELSRLHYKAGVLNLDVKNYILAKDYLEKAVEYAKSSQNKRLIKTTTSTLASYFQSQGENDKALVLYEKVINNMPINTRDSARLLMNIGTLHKVKRNFSIAKESYAASLELRLRLNDSIGIANAYNNIGQLYIELKDYKTALGYLDKAYDYAIENGIKNISLSSSFNLIELYMQLGRKDSAIALLHNYINLRSELDNNNIKTQLIELDKKYKTLEKDTQIAQLQKEDALNQARLKNKNILIIAACSFLLLFLVVAYLINRQRKELVQSRKRLLRQKEDITGMNEQLRVSNLAKDRILSVIGHDLRGPVGGLKELIELYLELPEYEPNDIKNLLTTACEASTSTYHLLENLLSWANSQRGDIEFNPMLTPIVPLIKQSVQLLDRSINVRNVRFEFDIPQALVAPVDVNMLRTVIRNLVSNALKYSPENGLVKIIGVEEDKWVKLGICDQGKGMSEGEARNIFKKKETYFIGSELTAKGTGLGLILCKEFVERHGGTIWINSEEGVGTQVWFSIPQKGVTTTQMVELQQTEVQ